MDITRATEVTLEAEKTIEDMFTYHPWTDAQTASGNLIREALAHAFGVIVAFLAALWLATK